MWYEIGEYALNWKIHIDEQLNLIKFTGLNKFNDMKLITL